MTLMTPKTVKWLSAAWKKRSWRAQQLRGDKVYPREKFTFTAVPSPVPVTQHWKLTGEEGHRGRRRRRSSSLPSSKSRTDCLGFRLPTGRQAVRENNRQGGRKLHSGSLLAKGKQVMKYHCSSVLGSGSGKRFSALAMTYQERVALILDSAYLSDREVRERETLACALGQLSQEYLAGLGDVRGPLYNLNGLWPPSYRQVGGRQVGG